MHGIDNDTFINYTNYKLCAYLTNWTSVIQTKSH